MILEVDSSETSSLPATSTMLIRLRPEQRKTYLKVHAEVWPQVAATIRACNIRNYTIFLRGDPRQ